jgi:hypothetical protein
MGIRQGVGRWNDPVSLYARFFLQQAFGEIAGDLQDAGKQSFLKIVIHGQTFVGVFSHLTIPSVTAEP